MKLIREIYPLDEAYYLYKDGHRSNNFSPPSYDLITESFGFENVLEVTDKDYQGDTRILFKDNDKYGLLFFGWGSCSGCDALQACESYDEVENLQQNLFHSIIWKDNREDMLKFIIERDWKVQWSWHAEETKEFIRKSIEFLGGNESDVEKVLNR